MIEPTGYTALDLVGFTDRGTYAANVNYVKNDLVHYGGNIWRILIDDTIGITPAEGTKYTLFIGEPTNLVERIIAPLEDNPATVAYTTGRQIIYNDYLYEVIQDIAIGDVLIAYEDDPTNANIKLASPVETQVLALNGRMDTAEADIVALETGKADTSVIAPVESGTTALRAYAAGAHFIKNDAFCTAKTVIERGETFTLNTNYTSEDIGSELTKKFGKTTLFTPTGAYVDSFDASRCTYTRIGNATLVEFQVVLKSTATSSTGSEIINASDIGLRHFEGFQFGIAYSNSNSIVKVVANSNTSKIQFETLIGDFPANKTIYGQIMIKGAYL